MTSVVSFSYSSVAVPANHKKHIENNLYKPFSLAEFRRFHPRRNLKAVASRHVVYAHTSEGAAVVDLGELAAICAFYLNSCHNCRY